LSSTPGEFEHLMTTAARVRITREYKPRSRRVQQTFQIEWHELRAIEPYLTR
jgi:hypothetical protein